MYSNALQKKIEILRENQNIITTEYAVKRLGIFGSYAQGKQTKASDLDILVEFSHPIGFLRFLALEIFLTKVLRTQVDLVTKKALKKAVRKQILNDLIYVR